MTTAPNRMIQVHITEVIMDTTAMTAAEVGEHILHVFACWQNGTVGECCPEWVREQWAKAVACNFRGYQKPQGKYRYYGPQWPAIRMAVLDRDGVCRGCKRGGALDVHHRLPFVSFQSRDEANEMSNLVALCRPCHAAADGAYRRSGVVFVEVA